LKTALWVFGLVCIEAVEVKSARELDCWRWPSWARGKRHRPDNVQHARKLVPRN